MTKELTHRADDLKALGWSNEEITRYVELWDYRQRWGAINLEREDRLFLRKAEAVLPELPKGKASVKKPIKEKSYYRWLTFYLDEINKAENNFNLKEGSRGLWPIILEEELRALDYYQPVLGLPDTLKAKQLDSFREEIILRSISNYPQQIDMFLFDFSEPLETLKKKESTKWRQLREGLSKDEKNYPVLHSDAVEGFRKDVRSELTVRVREVFPSLSESDKPNPPEDWIPD